MARTAGSSRAPSSGWMSASGAIGFDLGRPEPQLYPAEQARSQVAHAPAGSGATPFPPRSRAAWRRGPCRSRTVERPKVGGHVGLGGLRCQHVDDR